MFDDILKDLERRGARYADARRTGTDRQEVRIRNGVLESIASSTETGIGVRVLMGNGWGFAADSDDSEAALRRAALRVFAPPDGA